MRYDILAHAILIASLFSGLNAAYAQVPEFEPPLMLEPATDHSDGGNIYPDLATDGAGTWIVAAEAHGDLRFARSIDHGLTFTPMSWLNTDYATDTFVSYGVTWEMPDKSPSVAGNAAGRFIAVWERRIDITTMIELSRSNDGGATWSPPSTFITDVHAPWIASDGANSWIIVWTGNSTGARDFDLYSSRSTDAGATWSVPELLVSGQPYDIREPHVTWSGGVWLVSWWGMGASEADVYVMRSTDGGIAWSSPTAVNSNAAADTVHDSGPTAAGDGAGNWVVVWTGGALSGNGSGNKILAVRSADAGQTWSAPDVVNAYASDDFADEGPTVGASPSGTFVAAWAHRDVVSSASSLVTSSSTDAGSTWSPAQFLKTASPDTSEYPEQNNGPLIAHDPAGHWLSAWNSNGSDFTTAGAPMLLMSLGDQPCGDGELQGGEQCDTGHRGSLDCCSRTCALEPPGATCAADADRCTLEKCDGAGTCEHSPAPAGTRCDADDDVCTVDQCDGAANCAHEFVPRLDCKHSLVPGASKIEMYDDGTADGRSVRWKWKKGEATVIHDIGHAPSYWNFSVCAYDSEGSFVMRLDAPQAPDCFESDGFPCWRQRGSSIAKAIGRYTSKDGEPTGMTNLAFRFRADRKTAVTVKGKGPNLELPTLPLLHLPLTVQLVHQYYGAEETQCWENTFSEARESTATTFSGAGD